MSGESVTLRPTEPLSSQPSSYAKGRPNPERPSRNAAKRKQKLLALLSELADLRDEELEREVEDPTPAYTTATQDDSSLGGVILFRAFDRQAQNLDHKLQGFANAVRQLGSSVGLLNATYYLRGALIQIQFLFRANAAELFKEIRQEDVGSSRSSISNLSESLDHGQTRPRYVAARDRAPTGLRPQIKPISDLESFPDEMRKLARQVHVFVDRLNDMPEFTDELVNMSFSSFADDLEYHASCLVEFKGQLKTVAVQRYVNDLSGDISAHMESMREALNDFIDVGVPIIQHARKHRRRIAVSFCCCDFLQCVGQTGDTLTDLVNALWTLSLIFSIASAINSQLAYHWCVAIYRSPHHYVPWWVAIWMSQSPLFLLAGAAITFSIGLCVLTYSSGQNHVVSALTTAFTIVTSFGLLSVGIWFISERWAFSRTRGQRWLFDILSETQDKIGKALGITWMIQHWPEDICAHLTRWMRAQIHDAKAGLAGLIASCTGRTRQGDEEQVRTSNFISGQYPRSFRRDSGTDSEGVELVEGAGIVEGPRPPRLKILVEQIIAMNRARKGKAASAAWAGAKSDMATGAPHPSCYNYAATFFAEKTRLQGLKSGLANLQITQLLDEHMALVKHMQLSPNGDLLATCSWDRTAIIWKIGSNVELCWKLRDPNMDGFVIQVAWSPDGRSLLTRTQKTIKVWDPRTGSSERAINRKRPIHSAAWMPSGNGFLTIEYVSWRGAKSVLATEMVVATNLVRLDLDGQVLEKHKLDRIQVWDMAIMEDETRVLAIGTLLKTTDHRQPTKSRVEKRLIVYNMKTQEVEHHVPLIQDVRCITLSTQTSTIAYVLVSSEDRSPPQMWGVHMQKCEKVGEQVARLILVHSYLTKTPADFAGQSYFGGPNDRLVCSSSKSGEIFIWDRTSTTLLHTLRLEGSEAIKNSACNHKAAPWFMLASGALDGSLYIWSSGAPIPIAPPSEQTSPCPETQSYGRTATPPQRGISSGSTV